MPSIEWPQVSKSSYFLGDPPPDPRFLASLGELSKVEPQIYQDWELQTQEKQKKLPAIAVTTESSHIRGPERSEPRGIWGPGLPGKKAQQAKRAIVSYYL
jgi:hypothetical protein